MVAATTTRDSFVKATVAAGMSCSIAPPQIVLEAVSGYASYDPATNTIKTAAWEQLTETEKNRVVAMLGPGLRRLRRELLCFGANHLVFVRELESWWLACRRVSQKDSASAFESGVDRVETPIGGNRTRRLLSICVGFSVPAELCLKSVAGGTEGGGVLRNELNRQSQGTNGTLLVQARMCLAAFDE